ncbi:hypothetical protein VPH35_137849 [Triticum aestivum]
MGREEAVAKEEEQRGDRDLQCGNEGVHWSTPHRGEDKRLRRGVAGAGCRDKMIGNLGDRENDKDKSQRSIAYLLLFVACVEFFAATDLYRKIGDAIFCFLISHYLVYILILNGIKLVMINLVDSKSPFWHSVSLFENKTGLPLLAHEFVIFRNCAADLGACRFRSDPVTRSSRELQGQVKDECGSVQFRQQELHCDHGTISSIMHVTEHNIPTELIDQLRNAGTTKNKEVYAKQFITSPVVELPIMQIIGMFSCGFVLPQWYYSSGRFCFKFAVRFTNMKI